MWTNGILMVNHQSRNFLHLWTAAHAEPGLGTPSRPPSAAPAHDVDLEEEVTRRVFTFQAPPRQRFAERDACRTRGSAGCRGCGGNGWARLVVVGVEVGGRFGAEAASFLRQLARYRAASLPPLLRAAASAGWVQRWSGFLAVAAMRAYAASLLELPPGGDLCDAGEAPDLHEVLAEVRGGLLASRLPAPRAGP